MTVLAGRKAISIDVADHVSEFYLHSEIPQSFERIVGKILPEVREYASGALDDNHPGFRWLNGAEVTRECFVCQFGRDREEVRDECEATLEKFGL